MFHKLVTLLLSFRFQTCAECKLHKREAFLCNQLIKQTELFNKLKTTKYIANLYCIIGDHVKLGEFGKENAKLFEKERLLEKILETGVDEELLEKLKAYWELQGEIRGEVEREGFICGFRTAYHLLNECRS